ncbi:MAG: hypothetical protein WC343_04520 [Bacilli bacterium]|jgi:hypothetical protein
MIKEDNNIKGIEHNIGLVITENYINDTGKIISKEIKKDFKNLLPLVPALIGIPIIIVFSTPIILSIATALNIGSIITYAITKEKNREKSHYDQKDEVEQKLNSDMAVYYNGKAKNKIRKSLFQS